MLDVLNEYFDRLAGAVLALNGEVLKFIGDGVLAVFPFSAFGTERAAAAAALQAAQQAFEEIEALNEDECQLASIEGWRPLGSGISLHRGEKFFGNLGTAKRLDFTVIGNAVNTVSRVEALCKDLEQPILTSGPVADLIDTPLENLGSHELRGVNEANSVFAPKE